MESLPLILFQVGTRTGIITLGNIITMSVKKFLGKFLEDEGSRTTTGTLVSIIPASGKTFYFGGSKCSSISKAGTNPSWTGELQNDGVVLETYKGSIDETNQGFQFKGENVNKIVGDSLDGDGVKEFRIQVTTIGGGGAPTIEGNMFGFIEDDADNPLADFQ